MNINSLLFPSSTVNCSEISTGKDFDDFIDVEWMSSFDIMKLLGQLPGKGKRGCKKEDLLSLPWDQIRCDDDDDDDDNKGGGVYDDNDDEKGVYDDDDDEEDDVGIRVLFKIITGDDTRKGKRERLEIRDATDH